MQKIKSHNDIIFALFYFGHYWFYMYYCIATKKIETTLYNSPSPTKKIKNVFISHTYLHVLNNSYLYILLYTRPQKKHWQKDL